MCNRRNHEPLLTPTPHRNNQENQTKNSIHHGAPGLRVFVPDLQARGLLHVIPIFRRKPIFFRIPWHLLWLMGVNLRHRYSSPRAYQPAALDSDKPTQVAQTRN